jgi:hypothetical protein
MEAFGRLGSRGVMFIDENGAAGPRMCGCASRNEKACSLRALGSHCDRSAERSDCELAVGQAQIGAARSSSSKRPAGSREPGLKGQ